MKKVTQALGVCIAVLVTASTLGQLSKFYLGHDWVFGLVPRFALDGEGNIPSWYSSGTLLTICVLLAAISVFARQTGDSWWRYWSGLSVIFLWLSMDEAASIHELLTSPARRWLGASGIFYWAWVVPGLIFVALLAVVYMRFVLALPRTTRSLFILSAITFLAGALGVEMMVGPWVESRGQGNFVNVLFWTAEEALEMTGVAVFIYALLHYMERFIGSLSIRVSKG